MEDDDLLMNSSGNLEHQPILSVQPEFLGRNDGISGIPPLSIGTWKMLGHQSTWSMSTGSLTI
ncbi:hypothetical protein [Tardiphaga sp. 839_C3_N1_4]|jgi:hypothetical protein|uniref:hypothetical protein n=1 Tax=Tardiphaga sp. 839_C3_N1_4 TaxID=3240761 RepID=UPI003F260E43